ncbi:unnamed protein product [Mesocestoides corti]|uniref:Protein kinase domain-containing protein n=1 Tax=Mesocestoides corti TaxID=53468 RepID=A0A158QW02_MESCO|nr:unnamed protein product [Mesocestoides corti]
MISERCIGSFVTRPKRCNSDFSLTESWKYFYETDGDPVGWGGAGKVFRIKPKCQNPLHERKLSVPSNAVDGEVEPVCDIVNEIPNGKSLAIKIIRRFRFGRDSIEKIRKEIEMIRALQPSQGVDKNASVPSAAAPLLFSVHEDPTQVAIVMEYASGGSLFDLCRSCMPVNPAVPLRDFNLNNGLCSPHSRVPEPYVSSVLVRIVDALAYMHDKANIVHLDIKASQKVVRTPVYFALLYTLLDWRRELGSDRFLLFVLQAENILLREPYPSPDVFITDFGLASVLSKSKPHKELAGTPDYTGVIVVFTTQTTAMQASATPSPSFVRGKEVVWTGIGHAPLPTSTVVGVLLAASRTAPPAIDLNRVVGLGAEVGRCAGFDVGMASRSRPRCRAVLTNGCMLKRARSTNGNAEPKTCQGHESAPIYSCRVSLKSISPRPHDLAKAMIFALLAPQRCVAGRFYCVATRLDNYARPPALSRGLTPEVISYDPVTFATDMCPLSDRMKWCPLSDDQIYKTQLQRRQLANTSRLPRVGFLATSIRFGEAHPNLDDSHRTPCPRRSFQPWELRFGQSEVATKDCGSCRACSFWQGVGTDVNILNCFDLFTSNEVLDGAEQPVHRPASSALPVSLHFTRHQYDLFNALHPLYHLDLLS